MVLASTSHSYLALWRYVQCAGKEQPSQRQGPSLRRAEISRNTNETRIAVSVHLDGEGRSDIQTGIGFLDHMLEQLARHSLIDMHVRAEGDTHIDLHHTTEDVGIVLGQAIGKALGERRGITRYASIDLPMDEACTRAAIDVSGRPYLIWQVRFSRPKVGDFDTELFREFFHALATNAGLTLHIVNHYGENNHHIAETCFKAAARVMRAAFAPDPRTADAVPSTKGTLTA
jgi:imidazoleglycerol-phosphate dehydratase